jgi:hypothetical protein
LVTPCERTHWAKATCWEFVDREFGEPPGPLEDGLPPQAAEARTSAVMAMPAAMVRAHPAWTAGRPGVAPFRLGVRFMPVVLRRGA